jgi:hypothetical protein
MSVMRYLTAIMLATGFTSTVWCTAGAEEPSAAPQPGTVAHFVVLCAQPDKSEVCKVAIQIGSIEVAVKHGPNCGVREPDEDRALRRVVEWLTEHSETHSMPTRDGITTAIVGVWCS